VLGSYVLINSAISIAILAAIAALTKQPFRLPFPGGPTAFLLFYAAIGAQAAPRNVFCGHLIGVLAGYLALVIFGLTTTPASLTNVTAPRIGAVTLSLCLTLSVMVWLHVPHAPAGATTLIVALGLMRTPGPLNVLIIAVVLMIGQGIAINRLASLPYPWWGPPGRHGHTTATRPDPTGPRNAYIREDQIIPRIPVLGILLGAPARSNRKQGRANCAAPTGATELITTCEPRTSRSPTTRASTPCVSAATAP
jgi:CBS domain-containing membrane protein